jgi:hypothetical protein
MDKLLNLFFLLCGTFYLILCTGLPWGTLSSPGEGMVPVIMGGFGNYLYRRESDG